MDQKNLTANSVCAYLENILTGCSAFPHGGGIVAFFNLTLSDFSMTDLMERMVHFVEDSSLNAGFSRCMNGHMNLRRQYIQAKIALQFGTREEMIALANERLQLLRDRGYEDACIYGENEMEGLHVIQVLKHGTKPHGAVENPQIPPAAFLSGIMKPVTAVGAGATVLGLAAMFGLAAGYKRDTLVYNDGNGDTISLETGEVTKQGNGPDERTVMEAITENLPIGKKGGDDHE